MARTGRPKAELVLSAEEREALSALLRRSRTPQSTAQRARIVLACAAGATNKDVAAQEGVSAATVGKWRRRFVKSRLDALGDLPRSGAPRTISDEDVDRVIETTLQKMPRGRSRWTTRRMAKATSVSQSTVARIWRAFGLKPHRTETFKLSTDPYFIDKVRDVVGLYMNPPERAIVLCVDEKSQIQALERSQPLLPFKPGVVAKQTHDYQRHGTTSLFAALNIETGKVIGKCYRRHRSAEFIRFLRLVDKQVPKDLEVHLVLDNYGTHKTALIHNWCLRHPRFHLHFTPTSASWLNLVESWFSKLTRECVRSGDFRSTASLEKAIREYLDAHNADPEPFIWTKSADEIIESVRRLCEAISDTEY